LARWGIKLGTIVGGGWKLENWSLQRDELVGRRNPGDMRVIGLGIESNSFGLTVLPLSELAKEQPGGIDDRCVQRK